ncbi:PREDICTED: leucine-rich repeat neuronal protein 3-like [Dufourea novaeangliae]|uniref:Leucine-rich repeat neuronal protein 3 n=1 Tax=Dufourea novaeangliae TaxID=178035 RepID=A0A154PES5_DUFNO|nr:PREDICTED: leucine-rich repeat neuronal protein 3-like [Dufourea novaeangliae]KZC10349.1 Leucine-rich repeat neuronal protein 3 [Dufourea novaeangliae]
MDHRLLLVFIIVFSAVHCEDTTKPANTTATDNTTTEKNEKNETVATVAPKLPSLCTVCNCTGDMVNCTDRNLIGHFEDFEWRNTSVMSFMGNLLIHVTPFPKVVINKLVLQGNQITKIDDAAFMKLINLTELDLSHNNLTAANLQPDAFQGGFSPTAYEPLANLTVLRLAYNSLYSLHQDLFEHMSNLKVLDLSHNLFTQIDIRTTLAITSVQKLEELNLSYCGLKSLPDTQFYNVRNLKKLNLSGNRLNTPPAALGEAESLEYLYLDENPIQIINKSHSFPNMSKLKELSLCCMPHLTVVGEGAFSGLAALEHLRIESCPKLETIDEYALATRTKESEQPEWPPLKKLDLSDNALRYLPVHLVGASWDNLEELDLMNNKWSCDCDNQYLIGTLLPKYGKKLMGDDVNTLTCSAPTEHAGKNLSSLAHRKLRCLDVYGAKPEKDATILVGVLIGLILAVPVCLTLFVLWRRGFFFCGNQGPASFSRAFYKRATNDEDI